ncbi:wax ester/triacylglycerol synthase domain-containing protein, partial [Nocardia sp.]|uniref:wax ester/triacylglycerol synthase domain-containing protein n=1 Tax=Nocardia sp. TaxID=1821 RepID=UPI0026197EEA
MNSLAPRDATMYWLSARTRNDLFLLYCFADTGRSVARLRAELAARVARIPDLLVHVLDTPANIAYPIWVDCEFITDQFIDHELPDATWTDVTSALGDLLGTGVRAAHRPWRVHIFRGITGAPGFAPGEPALVVVLQLSHALADGRRAAALARCLFTQPAGTEPAPPRDRSFAEILRTGTGAAGWMAAAAALPALPIDMARTVIRGLAAHRAEQRLAELAATGAVPPPAPGAPPNLLNGGGSSPSAHAVRVLVHDAEALRVPGHTVTVVAATAISLALQRYLAQRGEPTEETAEPLLAQIPMAVAGAGKTRNSYCDLSVDLAVHEPALPRRATLIAAELAIRRERAVHPLQEARSRVADAMPARLLHGDVTHYPIEHLPERVSGHTVLSSVHRGPADLSFGGGVVRFTSGFPGLGSVMHLTHGVHGLGDTVTVSVHADPAVLPDLDQYAEMLNKAL